MKRITLIVAIIFSMSIITIAYHNSNYDGDWLMNEDYSITNYDSTTVGSFAVETYNCYSDKHGYFTLKFKHESGCDVYENEKCLYFEASNSYNKNIPLANNMRIVLYENLHRLRIAE